MIVSNIFIIHFYNRLGSDWKDYCFGPSNNNNNQNSSEETPIDETGNGIWSGIQFNLIQLIFCFVS